MARGSGLALSVELECSVGVRELSSGYVCSALCLESRLVCGHAFCKRRSIATKESRRIAMKRERQLEPEGTTSMRECDRLSKARHRALESGSEALLRKEHDRASKAKKRALEPESEALSATANL